MTITRIKKLFLIEGKRVKLTNFAMVRIFKENDPVNLLG